MSETIDQCLCGAPEAMTAFLRGLGLPILPGEEVGVPQDPRVLAATSPTPRRLLGQDAWIVRLHVSEALPLQEGIFDAPEDVATATTGVFAGSGVPASVSLRQLLFALRDQGWITHPEALAAAKTGAMPGALVQTLGGGVAAGALTQAQAEDAELTWASMYTAERTDGLWALFVAAGVATAEQVDDLFRAAGAR